VKLIKGIMGCLIVSGQLLCCLVLTRCGVGVYDVDSRHGGRGNHSCSCGA
jgi:hypothetical protein